MKGSDLVRGVYKWESIFTEGKVRHYVFKDLHSTKRLIEMQLIQYPIFLLSRETPSAMSFWLELLTSAHTKPLNILKDEKIPPVIRMAYGLLQERGLPREYRRYYLYQLGSLSRYSKQLEKDITPFVKRADEADRRADAAQAEVTKAKAALVKAHEKNLAIARNLKSIEWETERIIKLTGLSSEEIERL